MTGWNSKVSVYFHDYGKRKPHVVQGQKSYHFIYNNEFIYNKEWITYYQSKNTHIIVSVISFSVLGGTGCYTSLIWINRLVRLIYSYESSFIFIAFFFGKFMTIQPLNSDNTYRPIIFQIPIEFCKDELGMEKLEDLSHIQL